MDSSPKHHPQDFSSSVWATVLFCGRGFLRALFLRTQFYLFAHFRCARIFCVRALLRAHFLAHIVSCARFLHARICACAFPCACNFCVRAFLHARIFALALFCVRFLCTRYFHVCWDFCWSGGARHAPPRAENFLREGRGRLGRPVLCASRWERGQKASKIPKIQLLL